MGLLLGVTAPAPPATLPAAPAAPHRDGQFHVDMQKTVTYLASDELEGRKVGTPGIEKAASYIADSFSKLGLETVPGLDGYFQPFSMTTRVEPDAEKTSLVAGEKQFKIGDDFMPLHDSADAEAEGGVAFVGYGISDREHHFDEYDGVDVKGKIALIMRYEPHDPNGKSRLGHEGEWSAAAGVAQKVHTAVEHGAVGVMLANPAQYHGDEGLIQYVTRYQFQATVPVVHVTLDVADALLAQGQAPDLKTLQEQIDHDLAPHSRVLKDVRVKMSVAAKKTEKQVENVAALLPGKGPTADEYVVVGAHYDHLGHGGPGSLAPWSHDIHHGADDNASGTAAMLELADYFVHEGPQPRSILFIAFTGEEEGLIGSNHFVNHCPVPLEKIVAMLNLDMVGRVQGGKLLIGGEGTAADFAKLVSDSDKGLPLTLSEFGKGGLGPSDHMSFALKKIPVLFFFSGVHSDYHRPTDTADKINYKGMDEVVELGERVVRAMTTMPREPYNSEYDSKLPSLLAGSSHTSHGASMGAIPDYAQGEDATGGMRIGGVMPGSPADKAGLKEGDVVVEFNGKKIRNMYDYTAALGDAKPGQTVKVKVTRKDKPLEVETTLTTRKG